MDAIKEVVDENQQTINAPGVGFKGFIPAVFARLVNEKFDASVGEEAMIKVTAPEDLIRNRKARPDAWESAVITDKFSSPDWKKGDPFSEIAPVDDRSAFRLLVPEYYAASCLACHGEPAGEIDITGYPKEGGQGGRPRGGDQHNALPMTVASNADGAAASAASARRRPRPAAHPAPLSIPFRVAAISALLLAALIITNVIVIRELNGNSKRIAAATELFDQLEAANGASDRLRQCSLLADRPRRQPAHHLRAQRR